MSSAKCILPTAAACVALLGVGVPSRATGVSDAECRKFHVECTDALAQGYRDVGICNVERLECSVEPNEPSPVPRKTPPAAQVPHGPRDPERSVGP